MKKVVVVLLITISIMIVGCALPKKEMPLDGITASSFATEPPATPACSPNESVFAPSQTPSNNTSTHKYFDNIIVHLEKDAIDHKDNEDEYALLIQHINSIKESPEKTETYVKLGEIYMRFQEKSKALKVLEAGIISQGGSAAKDSEALLFQWWETLVDYSGDTIELSSKEIKRLDELVYLVSEGSTFLFAHEASAARLLGAIEMYCSKYLDRSEVSAEFLELYPYSYAKEYIVVFDEETVNKFILDVYGIARPGISAEYYADLKKQIGESYDEYLDVLERDYSEFALIRNREDIYYWDPWNPDPPTLQLCEYKYLGDDMYYLIYSGGYLYDESEVIDNLLHIVVKRSNNYWHFSVVAQLRYRHPYIGETSIRKEWPSIEGTIKAG